MTELINTTLEEIKQGYVLDEERGVYICSICGAEFAQGEVFPFSGRFYEARRAIQAHIAAEHGPLFRLLCGFDKKYTGLTPNQRELLTLMHEGRSDAQIAEKMEVTASTVRHQRFTFRERAKQARMYLAIYELACGAGEKNETLIEIPAGAKMLDERYDTTEPEEQKILSTFFYSLKPLKLRELSSKEKKKIVILSRIAREFERCRRYSEQEVNDILRSVYGDYATLRRYLIEYGFLDRERDGSAYWVK